jgi:MFS family permease
MSSSLGEDMPAAAAAGAATGRRTPAMVALACTIGNILSCTPVVQTSFGLFLIPIAREFAWPRARVSAVLGLLSLVTALSYPVVGRLADRFGPRRLILIGNLGFAASVAALSLGRPDVVLFYGLFALVGLFGAMPSTMMFTRVISGWFDAGRGTALGLASGLGNGIGATVMPIVAMVLMARFGWRGAFLGMGLIVAAVGFPVLAGLLRDPPGRTTSGEDGAGAPLEGLSLAQAARTGRFWMTLCAIALGAGCTTAVFAHVVPILSDRGYSVGLGTEVVSVFALTCAAWQPVVGLLLDRASAPRVIAPFYLVTAIGMVLLEYARSRAGLLGAGVLMGVGLGAEFGALPFLISRYFGLRRYGAIAGVMYSVVILAQGFTPFLMDASFDATGAYAVSMRLIQAALVLGALVLAILPAYATRKRALARPG